MNKVLVVEDDSSLLDALCDTLDLSGYPVIPVSSGHAAQDHLHDMDIGLVVSDVQMEGVDGLQLLNHVKSARPELPVLLMTAFGTIEQAVSAMREGASDYLEKPFEAQVLVSKVAALMDSISACSDDEFIAADQRSRELLPLAQRVADSDVTVLITGESGTGKEVLARFIHRHSARADGPFVAINCAAIPENMMEALLFGYEKGAFTGAHKSSPGKFEQAQGGTLLLDEISEMALGLQAKLLRVLQEREVEPLGARKPVALDVRVVATSNCDMPLTVSEGRFREDLYYRLNVFPLQLLPLRSRPGDIIPIAEKLLARAATTQARETPRLSPEAREFLEQHRWPGNVRELDNTLQRALVIQRGEQISATDLVVQPDLYLGGGERVPADAEHLSERLGDELKHQEYRLILDALNAEVGNRKAAAEKLGISPRTLRYKLARMRGDGVSVPGSSLV